MKNPLLFILTLLAISTLSQARSISLVKERLLPFLDATPIALDAGQLYTNPETSMYQTTSGITKQQLYSDYTLWKNAIVVLPSQPKKYSAGIFWVGVNPLNTTQSCYRLVPVLK